MSYSIPYGKSFIHFDIPKEFSTTVVTRKLVCNVKNVDEDIRYAISNPVNCKPLTELAKGKKSACVVVTDISRYCPDRFLLPHILEALEKEIGSEKISILIASGMHREMTRSEKFEKYGKKIVDRYKIIDHDAKDEDSLIYLGKTKNNTPIKISKIAVESDLLISTGIVEPHQYAGYSGGYKTVAIGIAGDETISYTHSTKILQNSKIRPGNIKENSFYEDTVEIGKKAGLDFIVNVILGPKKEILEIKAGAPYQTHQTLIEKAKVNFEVFVDKTFDAAICGVGFPKDTNLYQTSRAVSYLLYAPPAIIKKGGYIIVPAKCNEGEGMGIGEKRFFDILKNNSIEDILKIKRELKAGEQRAFLMANVLKEYKVIIVNAQDPKIVKLAKMIPATNMKEAFEIVKNNFEKKVDLILMPDAMNTILIKH